MALTALLLVAAPSAGQVFVDAARDGLLTALPPPPADDSVAGRADLATVRLIENLRSRDAEREAALDGDLPARVWAMHALGPGYTPQRQPAAWALFDDVRADMTRAVDAVKARGHQRARPHQRDPGVRPSLSVEGHGSNAWPSGRAAATRVWAGVLADLFPERAQALAMAAARSRDLRLIGGVHYPTDLVAGEDLADAFLKRLRANSDYKARLAGMEGAGER